LLSPFCAYTFTPVLIEFDTAKDEANRIKHGFSLADAAALEWDSALITSDARNNYGEGRYQALGLLGDRVCMVVFTMRGEALRVISMRKANAREEGRYAQQTQDCPRH
jgi:uncharacterized DUF497 family protein